MYYTFSFFASNAIYLKPNKNIVEKQIADLNVSGIDKEKISKSIKHKKGMYLTKSFSKHLFFCFHCTAFVFMNVSMNLVNPLKPCKEVTSYRFLYNIT